MGPETEPRSLWEWTGGGLLRELSGTLSSGQDLERESLAQRLSKHLLPQAYLAILVRLC